MSSSRSTPAPTRLKNNLEGIARGQRDQLKTSEAVVPSTNGHINLVMLGHVDHGKTTLTSAITKALSKKGQAEYVPYDKLDHAPEERWQSVAIARTHVEFKTQKRHYALEDFPGHADIL